MQDLGGNIIKNLENLQNLTEICQTETGSLSYLETGLVTKENRDSLLTWVLEITAELKLSTVTGLLACIYFDKFLNSSPSISLKLFELVGIVALSLAAKFKEGVRISAETMKMILGNRFKIDSILTTEKYMISKFNWELFVRSPCDSIEELFESSFSQCPVPLISTCFKFAALCYCDSEIARYGSFNISISSVVLGLNQHGFSKIKGEWLSSIEKSLKLEKRTIEIITQKIENQLLRHH